MSPCDHRPRDYRVASLIPSPSCVHPILIPPLHDPRMPMLLPRRPRIARSTAQDMVPSVPTGVDSPSTSSDERAGGLNRAWVVSASLPAWKQLHGSWRTRSWRERGSRRFDDAISPPLYFASLQNLRLAILAAMLPALPLLPRMIRTVFVPVLLPPARPVGFLFLDAVEINREADGETFGDETQGREMLHEAGEVGSVGDCSR